MVLINIRLKFTKKWSIFVLLLSTSILTQYTYSWFVWDNNDIKDHKTYSWLTFMYKTNIAKGKTVSFVFLVEIRTRKNKTL